MTDKEKFRKEVEKLKSQLLRGACSSQIAMETRCKEEAYNEVLSVLDTMQEEHVNRTTADVESAMQEVKEKSRVFTEVHKGEDADTILAQMRGEEPVSEDLGEYIDKLSKQFQEVSFAKLSRIAVRVAKWQKEKLWKPADGDDLPIFDSEVIVLIKYNTQRNIHDKEYSTYKVGFGHRPNPDGWDGKNIDTNEVTHYTPKLYDKGGWNAPDIVYWLDIELPKEIEL